MNFKINTKVAGMFTFNTVDSKTGKITNSITTSNMIVDSGLESIGEDFSLISSCVVGGSNSPVNVTDKKLISQIAETNIILETTFGAVETPPYNKWIKKVFRFDRGLAEGALREVGVRDSKGNLFSRALIKNNDGTPITLNILPDEFLDVVYELKVYISEADTTKNITVNGVQHSVTIRPANIATGSEYVGTGVASNFNSDVHSFYSGSIGTIKTSPGGIRYSHGRRLTGDYVKKSRSRVFNFSAGLGNANFENGLRSLLLETSQGDFQVEFSPALPKDSSTIISIDLTIQWGRDARNT